MRKGVASFYGLAVIVISVLGGARTAPAQQPTGQVVRLGEGETLTIGGFISATLFNDRGLFSSFGQGQNAEIAAAPANQPAITRGIFDGDVRNTRINFTFNASPVLGKWAPRATLEADFFGAFSSAPPFGDEQPQFRIRHAYVDLTNGRTTLRIGQFWAPLFNTDIPVSLTHIAFPVGLGSGGVIGWRFPGVFLYHDLTAGKPVTVQLQLAAFKGSGPAVAAALDTAAAKNIGNGEASGLPQLEARLNFARRSEHLSWSGYAVGHLDWKDTTGTGVAGDNLTGWGVEAGGSVAPRHFTLHGTFYYGKDLGQQFAHIAQFSVRNIRGWGAWAQAGYDFTPHWSLWAYYGMDQPNAGKFAQDHPTVVGGLPRLQSHEGDVLLRFRAGRYALGLEYYRSVVRYNTGPAHTNQVALSVLYTL